jgi:hypothetical protein
MPEHVQLLVSEPKLALLSKAVQALKLSVSVRGQQRPFWQAHYHDFNVSTHEKFVEKLRYIHQNPVRRGFVARPEDWKWSSFRHYQTGMPGIVEIESEWTAQRRGWQLPDWTRYGTPIPTPRSPKARDRGHPQLDKMLCEIRATRQRGSWRGRDRIAVEGDAAGQPVAGISALPGKGRLRFEVSQVPKSEAPGAPIVV